MHGKSENPNKKKGSGAILVIFTFFLVMAAIAGFIVLRTRKMEQ